MVKDLPANILVELSGVFSALFF